MRTVWLGLLLLSVVVGCPASVREVASVDAGGSVVADAGPARDGALAFQVWVAGAPVVIVGGVVEVDSLSELTLLSPVALADCRVRLFDSADRVLPSDDTAELTAEGLRYHLRLMEPLTPGRRYTLVVDAQVGPRVLDEAGRSYEDLTLALQVRPRPAPATPEQAPRRRR